MGRVAQATAQRSSFNSSRAIAQLAAGRQQSRLSRKSNTSGRTSPGRISNYRPSVFNEESLYSSVSTPEEKSAKETQNRANWNADRQQQRQHQRNTALPAEAAGILKSAPDVAEDPEVQGYVNDYRNSLGRLEDRSSQRGGVDPVRRVIDRQKNKLKKELISKIRKSKIYQQGTKKLKKWIWRGIGPIGSIIEIEGLLCWTEFIFGLLVNGFQTLKSVVLPVVTEARPGDPNSGQIIKGVLSFAEPTSLDPKDPATWVIDAPYSAIWFFIINYVHLIVLAILTVIGSVVLVMSMGASVMGEYGTMIASMLGIT